MSEQPDFKRGFGRDRDCPESENRTKRTSVLPVADHGWCIDAFKHTSVGGICGGRLRSPRCLPCLRSKSGEKIAKTMWASRLQENSIVFGLLA